jgi:hypothetical protein
VIIFNILVGKKYPGCIKYQWLTDADRRYDFSSSTNQKCDNRLQGWYRFGGGAGTRMYAGSCRSSYACNANYPGYMSGSHPSVNEGIVARTVYFYHPSYGTCGYLSRSIKVINCADLYYVYQINGVPNCNGRYCSTN